MICPNEFKLIIVRPTIQALGIYTHELEDLLIGTAIAQSKLEHLLGFTGFGFFCMTPPQHDDLWARYLPSQTYILSKMLNHCQIHRKPLIETLIYHLTYACAMASLVYHRDPEPIPKDLEGQAEYYKRVYNNFAETSLYIKGYEDYAKRTAKSDKTVQRKQKKSVGLN